MVNGCDRLQWFWHLPGYEDLELSVNETVSLAWNVEHTILQVVQSFIHIQHWTCINYVHKTVYNELSTSLLLENKCNQKECKMLLTVIVLIFNTI